MCGISAVFDRNFDSRPQDALRKMHDLLFHRGPDGEGHLWVNPQGEARSVNGETIAFPSEWRGHGLCASFRWLKVQNLASTSNQPMQSLDGQYAVLFNGEIYNHAELRQQLMALGAVFRTGSDTEVLLQAYQQWGMGCLDRMRGMWAFLCVDLVQRRLVMARDRLGIKPLFYAVDGNRLLIASEAKAVAMAREGGPRADPFRAHEYLRGLPPQSAELSFFEGVFPVPPGSFLSLPLDVDPPKVLQFDTYWRLSDSRMQDLPEADFESWREQFEMLLRSVADEHASAAVNVGTLLSGGLDTSTLARLLAARQAELGKGVPKAYSIIYEDPEMSEWPYMQLVIGQGGLQGVKHVLKPDEAWDTARSVVWTQGQPLLGQDIIAQFQAYKLARAHGSVVVWDGQGADELLAGMPLYEAQWLLGLLRQGQLVNLAKELVLRNRRYQYGMVSTVKSYIVQPLLRHWNEHRGRPHPTWLHRGQVDSSRFGLGRTSDMGPERSPLTRYLYRHVRHTNLPQVLTLQDHCAMAHGVESRVPFLDHRIVEFVFRLPDHFKLKDGIRKRILLETAKKILPPQIIERRDKRVFVSKGNWMHLRERHAAALNEMASSRELREFGLIEPKTTKLFVESYINGRHNDEMAVWRLHSLWQWLQLFNPTLR